MERTIWSRPVNSTLNPRTVADEGEQQLLQRLQRYCPSPLVGDDAASLAIAPGHQLIVTTDALVDGVHFSDRTTPAHAVGWRAAAANLSDLAAMGAEALGITVALLLPPETSLGWVEALYGGLADCLDPWRVPILGGDLCRSPARGLSITALGQAQPDRLIRRCDARPGDLLIASGWHGLSRAGLACLLAAPTSTSSLPPALREACIQAHRYPQPRLDVPPLVEQSRPPGQPWRVGGMDSSDGLADAVLQICRASQCGARLQAADLPLLPALSVALGWERAVQWGLYGGEDFELVLSLTPEWAIALLPHLGDGARILGQVTVQPEVLLEQGPDQPPHPLHWESTFQHFA
jgi:thiamine-monophosphate kinase